MMTSKSNRLFGLAVALSLVFTAPAVAQDVVAPRITAIRAQLYYEETATFSEDIVSPTRIALWNVIIGEGDAEHASNSTLVTVEVRGQHVPVGAVRIEIAATDVHTGVVVRRSMTVDLYDDQTTFYAPLFLYDTGCSEIALSAHLIGDGVDPTPSTGTIQFRCGE